MNTVAMPNKKQNQLRFLSQSARLEEAINPLIIRMTSWAISISLISFLAWASITNISEVSRAPGEVTPQGFQQIVQHFEGGLVHEIHVSEGDVVQKGQILMILDGVGVQEDLVRAKSEQIFLSLQKERLKAYVDHRKPNFEPWKSGNETLVAEQSKIFDTMMDSNAKERSIIQDQIAQKKQAISVLSTRLATTKKNQVLMETMHERRSVLHGDGYISDMKYLESEQELNRVKGDNSMLMSQIKQSQQEIKEYNSRLESLDAKNREQAYQQLNAIEGQLVQNQEIIEKISNRVTRLEIKSPVRGLVKGLNVNTIGGVIQPGESLMEIIPLDRQLVIEVRIPPQQVGHLKIGMPVQVKVSSFDFARYGSIRGELEFISPTTFEGERGERFYRGRIKLDQNYVGKNPRNNIILPGMTVMADIITGEKTVMSYLLKPIHNSLKTAFTER